MLNSNLLFPSGNILFPGRKPTISLHAVNVPLQHLGSFGTEIDVNRHLPPKRKFAH